MLAGKDDRDGGARDGDDEGGERDPDEVARVPAEARDPAAAEAGDGARDDGEPQAALDAVVLLRLAGEPAARAAVVDGGRRGSPPGH